MKSSVELGMQAIKDGRFSDAIVFLESSIKFHPDNPKIWLLLARAYQQENRLEDARNAFQQVLDGCQDESLCQVAQQGIASLKGARVVQKQEMACPECGASIPPSRHSNPWCLCGWNTKAKVVSNTIYLHEIQAYCQKQRCRIEFKRQNDILILDPDGLKLQGFGAKTFPVDPRLAFPLKDRLAILRMEDLKPLLTKVESDELFRERMAGGAVKMFTWGAFLARVSDGLGYDITRPPDITLGGLMVAYGALTQAELDRILPQRKQGETVGQTLFNAGVPLERIIEGVIGRGRLGKTSTRSFAQRLGTMLVESGLVSAEDLKRALYFQAQEQRPIGQLLKCPEAEFTKVLRRQRAVKVELAEADYLGEVLVQQGVLTRTDLVQALLEEQSKTARPLGEILASMGWCSPESIKRALGYQSEKKRLVAEGAFRLGQVLVDQRLLTREQLGKALAAQVETPQPLGEILVARGICTPEAIIQGLEEQSSRIARKAWQGDQGEGHEVRVMKMKRKPSATKTKSKAKAKTKAWWKFW